MSINFHDGKNRNSYKTRHADPLWQNVVKELVPIDSIKDAVDIGCGGGIYTQALADLGIDSVLAVDYSEVMVEAAKENCKDYDQVSFQVGNAFGTGLENDHYDLILERALIHHLDDLQACFQEAYRVLRSGGYYLVQDRTLEDCLIPGNNEHIRGYFFEHFPQLIEKETGRRHDHETVMQALEMTGFRDIKSIKLWETRQVYERKEQLLQDLRHRTGRSILHELSDKELNILIDQIDQALISDKDITEKDRWTIWVGVK